MEPENPYLVQQIRELQEIQYIKKRIASLDDSLQSWIDCYLDLQVRPSRDEDITAKITLHLTRFIRSFFDQYEHMRISTCLQRDVISWRDNVLSEQYVFAPATINNHIASLSHCFAWIDAQAPQLFPTGNPCRNVKELPLPAMTPQTLSDEQIILMKSLWDRLPNLHEKKGQRYQTKRRRTNGPIQPHGHARPYRDRAILYVLLATGLRREEVVNLDLNQLVLGTGSSKRATVPVISPQLHEAHAAQLVQVKGKGRTMRNLFVSAEARTAIADYLERERHADVEDESAPPQALFLRAASIRSPRAMSAVEHIGRMDVQAINYIFEHVKQWYNAQLRDDDPRRVAEFHPHVLRHTYGRRLAEVTNNNEFELQRRLGHLSKKYIQLYTQPTSEVAAGYVEEF